MVGDEEVGDVVVVGTRPLETLHEPSVGEDDVVTVDDGRHQHDLAVGVEHEVAVLDGEEPSTHEFGVTRSGTEVPRSGDAIAALTALALSVGGELAAHGDAIGAAEGLGESGLRQVCRHRCCRWEIGDTDPAERTIEFSHRLPCVDHVGERGFRTTGLGGIQIVHEPAVPHGLDHRRGHGAVAFTFLGLGHHEIGDGVDESGPGFSHGHGRSLRHVLRRVQPSRGCECLPAGLIAHPTDASLEG